MYERRKLLERINWMQERLKFLQNQNCYLINQECESSFVDVIVNINGEEVANLTIDTSEDNTLNLVV